MWATIGNIFGCILVGIVSLFVLHVMAAGMLPDILEPKLKKHIPTYPDKIEVPQSNKDNWRRPLNSIMQQADQPWWYQYTYPYGLRCPYCHTTMPYKLDEEIWHSNHSDIFSNHWRLFTYTCIKCDYIWQERV